MSRYYFDIHNGDGSTRDHEGIELLSKVDASREAMRILTAIAADEIRETDLVSIVITVRDGDDVVYLANARIQGQWFD